MVNKTTDLSELEKEETNDILDHPTRLKLYLYIRSQKKPVGIRETQRELGINSPSTVNWHLDKLVEARYLIKNHDNRYQLNANHDPDLDINIPINFSVILFRNKLITPISFILTFLLVMLLLTVVLWFIIRDPFFIGLQGAVSLIVSIIAISYIDRKMRKEIEELAH